MMKNLIYIVVVFAAALLSSCEKTEEYPRPTAEIVGTWKLQKTAITYQGETEEEEDELDQKLVFRADGTMITSGYDIEFENGEEIRTFFSYEGTYSVSADGRFLVLTDDEESETFTILTLNANSLHLSVSEGGLTVTLYFIRQ